MVRKWRMAKRLYAGVLSASLLGWAVLAPAPAPALAEEQDPAWTRLAEVYQLLATGHVSGTGGDALSDSAIEGMISLLNDPYTEYYSEKEWEQFQANLSQNYTGIGTRLGQEDKRFVVVQVFDGSPAADAGIRRGDEIVEVNGKAAGELTFDQLAESVRGPEGTEVSLTLLRGETRIQLKVKRRSVHVPEVVGAALDGGTGYIQVTGFSQEADELFAAKLDDLKRQGIRSLIVDLRNNPGGVLETAQHIAAQFISEGVLIHTKDRNGSDRPVPIENGKTVSFPVLLLVNEGSASASEVLAGAMQDYGKATVIGTKTYGKGSVQSIYKLSTGGAIKVTTEEYMTPKGRAVNKVGITPDLTVEGRMPQMLNALRKSGSPKLSLVLGKHSVKVNGFELFEPVDAVRENGSVYVPARVLAALVGQPLQWNGETGAVEIGTGPAAAVFSSGNGFMNREGTGYIDVERFAERFPQMKWESAGNEIVLEAKGDG